MRRTLLRVWADTGTAVDPDLDELHPSGNGGAGKYELGWVVEKEPHQWANFIYQTQTGAQYDFARYGVSPRESLDYKLGALSWSAGGIIVKMASAWHRSFGTYTKTEAEYYKTLWTNNLATHAPKTDHPHQETAEQIGTIPSTGGTFTGEVFYRGGFQVGGAQWKYYTPTADVWFLSAAIQKGFVATGKASFYNGAVSSELLLEDKIVEYERGFGNTFAAPEEDAHWPLKTNPYSMSGIGSLTVTGGDEQVLFGKFGLILEANKDYLLDDVSLVNYQGCMTALVNGVGVVKKAPLGTINLKTIFGAGVGVCDIKIWGYQLTNPQLANALAGLT